MVEYTALPKFCPFSIRDGQIQRAQRSHVIAAAIAAGVFDADVVRIASDLLVEYEKKDVSALESCHFYYGADATRRGSSRNPTGLPAIFGSGFPGDPEASREIVVRMATQRRAAVHG